MPWLGSQVASSALKGIADIVGPFVLTLFLGAILLFWWHIKQRREGKPGVQNWHLLAIGIVGTGIFVSLFAGAALWALVNGSFVTGPAAAEDDGPLIWQAGLSLTPGPNGTVSSLTFRGANQSQREVKLTDADITSAIKGERLRLEIVATNANGQNEIVLLEQVNVIPPGAPIELIARFQQYGTGGVPRHVEAILLQCRRRHS